jgi:hypothetical protein
VPQLVDNVDKLIDSPEFQTRHKESPKDFTRNRSLDFKTTISFFVNLNKGSYETELKQFFKTKNDQEVAMPEVTKSAVSKARRKLKPSAFIELNDELVRGYENQGGFQTWNGFRLVAVDGSTATVPDEDAVKDHFGAWNVKNGAPCPKARLSQLFDVQNRITLDALIRPKSEGERELATQHFIKLMPNDLVLLDRGYPAAWLFMLIVSLGAQFCARVKVSQWKIIKKFFKSGKMEKIVKLPVSYVSKQKCGEMGIKDSPIKVRLIRVELSSGETEILITSLLDKDKFQYDLFAELYFERWPIEEDYKVMKCRTQIENFSGKTVRSVYQDFHAKVFSKNLTMMIVNSTHPELKKRTENRKYEYHINFTQALSGMKNHIVLLLWRSYETTCDTIEKLKELMLRCIESIRPGRKYERNFHKKNKKFHLEYRQPA